MSLKYWFKTLFEEARWKASRDYDRCFWDCVRERRSDPYASPDNPRFGGDLRFGNHLPQFIKERADLARRWLQSASTIDDPLTRMIVGEMLFFSSCLSDDEPLDVERMLLLAGSYDQMERYERAISYCSAALEKAQKLGCHDLESKCRTLFDELKRRK